MSWTPELIALLRERWAAGDTLSVIAGKCGCSKNAAVGKAHRLKLTPRPSPIGVAHPHAPRKRKHRKGAASQPPAPLPRAVAAPRLVPAGPVPVSRACQWPLWGAWEGAALHRDPRPRLVPDFCGAWTRFPGAPYCAACHARAFTRAPAARPMREAA